MPFSKKISIESSIVKNLLNMYSGQTKLPAALYHFDTQEFIWSDNKYASPLCRYIEKISNKKCIKDHVKRCEIASGKIELCHAGLWNIALPIRMEGEIVGTLISGQRRLNETSKNQEALCKFLEFISKCDENTKRDLKLKYESTPIVDQEDFDRHLLSNLKNIQEHLYSLIFNKNKEREDIKIKIQNLGHELLLPIQSIIADTENLKEDIKSDQHLRKCIDAILDEMLKLAMIAENMRGTFIESEESLYIFEKDSIYSCLMYGIDLFQGEANKKGVVINHPIMEQELPFPRIDMSPDNLKRAFANIIHNAVKYSFSGVSFSRYIDIICKKTDVYCVIKISNYGIGILPEEIEKKKIFQSGYRGKLSADRHRTGSGVGLTEVKKIIKRHNGNITIKSENKGSAYLTTVIVYLPYKYIPEFPNKHIAED